MSTTKLDRLLSKKKQLDNQIQLAKAREKALARKQDTRRKILIGAVILSQIKKKKFPQKQLNEILETELVHDRDRTLFGLKLKEKENANDKAVKKGKA